MISQSTLIAGVDEVGRGPLAGPVVVCAVILPPNHGLQGLADSKKLSEGRRNALFGQILAVGHVCTQSANAATIDEKNIRGATLWCMQHAVAGLSVRPEKVLVDGRDFPDFGIKGEAIIGGDGLVEAISAASIVAKVLRDEMMERLDSFYPQYGFAKHKGYGTAAHIEAIKAHGFCPLHRKSFKVRLD